MDAERTERGRRVEEPGDDLDGGRVIGRDREDIIETAVIGSRQRGNPFIQDCGYGNAEDESEQAQNTQKTYN